MSPQHFGSHAYQNIKVLSVELRQITLQIMTITGRTTITHMQNILANTEPRANILSSQFHRLRIQLVFPFRGNLCATTKL